MPSLYPVRAQLRMFYASECRRSIQEIIQNYYFSNCPALILRHHKDVFSTGHGALPKKFFLPNR